MRFLMYTLGDESLIPDHRPPESMAELGAFMAQSAQDGVLLATGGIAPRSQGVEVRNVAGSLTVTDGPFSEAKELVGGFMLIQTPSKAAAVEWAQGLLGITGGEARIRQVYGPEDFGPG